MRKTKKHTTQQNQIAQMMRDINKYKEVLLLDADKNKIGIVDTNKAYQIAEEQQLDLILIAGNSTPPVVQLGLIGKYFYDQHKKQKNIQKNNIQNKQKEVTMKVDIADHDLNNKLNIVSKFLKNKQRVKIIIAMFHRYKHRKAGVSKNDLLNNAYTLFEKIKASSILFDKIKASNNLGVIPEATKPIIETKSFSFVIYPN